MRLFEIYLRKYKRYKYVWKEQFVYLRVKHFNLSQYIFTVYTVDILNYI